MLFRSQEPIHSGEYLAQELAAVTDSFEITGAIFTCTRDNASANTVMLSEYEKIASKQHTTIQQPWTFTVKEGDVRCIAHIINLAVQATLKSLKASPVQNQKRIGVSKGLPGSRSVIVTLLKYQLRLRSCDGIYMSFETEERGRMLYRSR